MTRRMTWLALCGALAALLAWLTFVWQPAAAPAVDAQQAAQRPPGGDFTLFSADGPVTLSAYRGRVVVVYFGYTFCPDICPTSLSTLAEALTALDADELEKVSSFLISVDPERDTKDVLKIYAPFFHPTIVGITGSAEQVAAVARLYGARYTKQKPNADGQYSVDHSSFIYLIGSDGKLAAALPHGSPPQEIVTTIRSLLAQSR